MTIGQRIKERRVLLKLTQEDVAIIVEVTKQTIQKYENNIITNIPSDKIELLAQALHCTPGYLMGWEGKSDKSIYDEATEEFKKLSEEDMIEVIDFIRFKVLQSNSKNNENNH